MIRRIGRTWALVAKNRVYLHDTKREAQAQEIAIRLAQARRAGYRVPPAPRKRR